MASKLKAPKPTAANVLQVLKGLSDSEWIGLGVHLHFPLDRDQFLSREKEDVVMLWLKLDPAPTWRRLISALDASSLYREDQSKVSIRQYAEPLTDPTLTLQNVTFAVLPVRDWKQLGESLGVPSLQIDEIDSKHPKREMKKLFALGYWLDYCPVVSWSKLASELYYWEEKESLQNVQGYLKKTPEPTLTLTNLEQALAEVKWSFIILGQSLRVPVSKLHKIATKYPDSAECERQILHHFLKYHPAPSWRVVFEGLYEMGQREEKCRITLQEVRRRYGRDLLFSDPFLPILDCKELDKQRSDTPLVVHFRHPPQYGTFSMLIAFLLSSDNRYPSSWELPLTDGYPTCLYQNCVKLTIPGYAGGITLIDSSTYFEAHANARSPNIRSLIREAIFTGAVAVLKCEIDRAIICPCKVGETHAATVGVDLKSWICSKNPSRKSGELKRSQKKWFEITAGPQQRTPSSIYVQVAKNREKIIEFLSANVSPEGFATELEIIGLINMDVREKAELTTYTKRERIRPVINAVITKLELNEENADKFKSVLKKLRVLADLRHMIN